MKATKSLADILISVDGIAGYAILLYEKFILYTYIFEAQKVTRHSWILKLFF